MTFEIAKISPAAPLPSNPTYGDMAILYHGQWSTCRDILSNFDPAHLSAEELSALCEALEVNPLDYESDWYVIFGSCIDSAALLHAMCRKCEQPITPVTRSWRVYGSDGHRQRLSFGASTVDEYSVASRGIWRLEIDAEDKTGTNDYVIVRITRNNARKCAETMRGQLSDGAFENCRYGKIEEIFN